MLCPKCGVEVGDTQTLCPRCAAEGLSSSGTALGRITPRTVMREVTPEERAAYEQAKADYYAGKTTSGSQPRIVYRQRRRRRSRVGAVLVLAMLLITGALVAQFLLPHYGGIDLSSYFADDRPPANRFAHINVRGRQAADIPQPDVLGSYWVDGVETKLYGARAHMSESPTRVVVEFYDSPAPSPELRPALTVVFDFAPGTERASLKALEGYTVIVGRTKPEQRFSRQFTKQLMTPVGEIARLYGQLAVGGEISASLLDTRSGLTGGRVVEVSWDLTFDTVIRSS